MVLSKYEAVGFAHIQCELVGSEPVADIFQICFYHESQVLCVVVAQVQCRIIRKLDAI